MKVYMDANLLITIMFIMPIMVYVLVSLIVFKWKNRKGRDE